MSHKKDKQNEERWKYTKCTVYYWTAKNAGLYMEYIFLRTEHIMVHFEEYLEEGPFKMSLSLVVLFPKKYSSMHWAQNTVIKPQTHFEIQQYTGIVMSLREPMSLLYSKKDRWALGYPRNKQK